MVILLLVAVLMTVVQKLAHTLSGNEGLFACDYKHASDPRHPVGLVLIVWAHG